MEISFKMKTQLMLAMMITLLLAGSVFAGVCEPLSPVSDNVLEHHRDYRPRLDFRHPDDGECSVSLPVGDTVEFSLWAWNLLDGIREARFQLISSGNIVRFLPAEDFYTVQGQSAVRVDGLSRLDLDITGFSVCGPILVGVATIAIADGVDGVFVDLDGYGALGMPIVQGGSGLDMAAVSPFHGAYAGATDLYHCQPALCAEPLAPITDFTPIQTGGMVIELGWTAGDGDFTMIRYRADGTNPTSIDDGELLMLFPAHEGQWQSVIHTNPDVPEYWYTAFNVLSDGDAVSLGSRLECGSFTTASVDESIANEDTTWSSIKNRYR